MPPNAKKHRPDEGYNSCVMLAPETLDSNHVGLASHRSVTFNGIVKLVVGGIPYMTTYRTLVRHEESRFAVYFRQLFAQVAPNVHSNLMCDDFVNITGASNVLYPTVFIDRNGDLFPYILNYLRDGQVALPKDVTLCRALIQEARYFGLAALENNISAMFTSDDCDVRTPRASQKRDIEFPSFVNMAVDLAPKLQDCNPIYSQSSAAGDFKPADSVYSLPSTSGMINTFEDSKSCMFSQNSYEDDLMSSQKSFLHVAENDNIEDSAVFVQTTPLLRLGKTEFSTTVDF